MTHLIHPLRSNRINDTLVETTFCVVHVNRVERAICNLFCLWLLWCTCAPCDDMLSFFSLPRSSAKGLWELLTMKKVFVICRAAVVTLNGAIGGGIFATGFR